jgi:hypothetical protein
MYDVFSLFPSSSWDFLRVNHCRLGYTDIYHEVHYSTLKKQHKIQSGVISCRKHCEETQQKSKEALTDTPNGTKHFGHSVAELLRI